MGRITPSFRQFYKETMIELKKNYQICFMDPERIKAFDLLLEEVWNREQIAMSNSNIPTILDNLNLTANIHNRKLIEMLNQKLKENERTIEYLKDRLDKLEIQIISKANVGDD